MRILTYHEIIIWHVNPNEHDVWIKVSETPWGTNGHNTNSPVVCRCVITKVMFVCTKDNTLNKYLTKYLLLGESAQWKIMGAGRGQELLVIFAWVHLYYLGQWTEVDPGVKIPEPASHQSDALIWHLKYIQQDERAHDEWSHGWDVSAEFIHGVRVNRSQAVFKLKSFYDASWIRCSTRSRYLEICFKFLRYFTEATD